MFSLFFFNVCVRFYKRQKVFLYPLYCGGFLKNFRIFVHLCVLFRKVKITPLHHYLKMQMYQLNFQLHHLLMLLFVFLFSLLLLVNLMFVLYFFYFGFIAYTQFNVNIYKSHVLPTGGILLLFVYSIIYTNININS